MAEETNAQSLGRLFGYMANRADRLQGVLAHEKDLLTPDPRAVLAGWGVGFYQGGEVLHKKRPMLGGEKLDWAQIAENVISDCVVVHLRNATVGDFRSENTHPFRMRSWLFAHKGTVERFDAVRERLVEQLPDFLRRGIRGQTDSEHLFYVVLSFLHDAGQLDRQDIEVKEVLNALRSSLALVDRLSEEVGGKPGKFNLILTNGRRMYALRRGLPMVYVQRQGPDLGVEALSKAPSLLKYVLVASNSGETTPEYREVDDNSVCVVDRSLNVSIHPL